MMKMIAMATLAALVAVPALAQTVPANNGVSQLNTRGTIATAPSYHGGIPAPEPYDEASASYAGGYNPGAPYTNHLDPAAHPGANGANWQPKNGHEGGA